MQDFVTFARRYDQALVLQDPVLAADAVSIFQQADAELVDWLTSWEELLAKVADE